MSRLLPPCTFLIFLAVSLEAAPATPAGRWSGAIASPTTNLQVQIDLRKTASGWTGDITIPAQNTLDKELAGIEVDGPMVKFEIPRTPGRPTFRGTLSADGKKISGDFTQSGRTFPFTLDRSTKVDLAATRLGGFDRFAADALKSWDVPGLAIAIVADGEVIFAKGYGKRYVKLDLAMTPNTIMPIGSITKSFTTLAMGMLVDEGKLAWDTPVRDYLTEFRTATTAHSEKLTPRDLVTHRSGLPPHDLSWYHNPELSRKDLVTRLASLPPDDELRSRYQYNNLMYTAAGYLVEQLTGKTWEDTVKSRIFTPLGMHRSVFTYLRGQRDADHARPYRYDEQTQSLIEIPFRDPATMGPAGSILSSANELSRWMLLHLNRGKVGETQLLEPTTMQELHTPRIPIPLMLGQPEASPARYGLGWIIDSYRGHERVHHGGHIDGFSAELAIFPRDGIGVVVLANADGTQLPAVVRDHAVDRILQLPAKDWNAEALARRARVREVEKQARAQWDATRRTGTNPSHPLDDYVGEYANDAYGVLKIENAGAGLQATYNRIVTPLQHWHYDVWNGLRNEKDPTFENMKYTFRTDVAGNIGAVEAPFESGVPPVIFRRRADAKLTDPGYLAQFAGEYTSGTQKVFVTIRGSQLLMTIGDQQPYVLEPDLHGWFNVSGLSGFRVRFVDDKLELSQPDGLFTAKRNR